MSDTKIERIRGYLVDPNLPALIMTGQDQPETRALELVCITLADGSVGISGTTTGWMGEDKGKLLGQLHALAERVLHRDASRPAAISTELIAANADGLPKAASQYDVALWDAFARHLNIPLWQLLGGYRDRIPVYASAPAFHNIEEYVDVTRQCIDAGYRAVKLHMNCDPAFDLEMVAAVAETFSDLPVRFMVDLEQRYTMEAAIRLGERLTALPYEWMEAPLPDTDLAAYAELNRRVGIDVLAAGNTLVGLANWERGLAAGAWSRLRCDVTNAGGITAASQAMALANAHGVANEIQSYGLPFSQFANLAVMLALPGCSWFEQPVPVEGFRFGALNPLTLDADGNIPAPLGPGTGLEVDFEAIEANATDRFDVH